MACLDHTCLDCGEMWSNNKSGDECPMCGSEEIVTWFDENYSFDEGEEEGSQSEEAYD